MAKHSTRATYLAAVVVAFVGSFAALAWAERDAPSASAAAAVETFTEVLRRFERIQFNELVTGDASLFPTIFYNDPRYPMQSEEWQETMALAGEEAISAAIVSFEPGPIGSESGFLSAKVAEHLMIWGNIEAWEEIQATATAEGRSPTAAEVASMPHGQTPYPRKSQADWLYVPFHVFDAIVDGNHAVAKLAYIEPEDAVGDWLTTYGGAYLIVWFTQVDGQWYISNMDSVVWPFTDEPPVKP